MADVKITVKPNGPYRVVGDVDLVDVDGNRFSAPPTGFSLCRCGHSNNKPFCDKSHLECGFSNEPKAPAPGPPTQG